MQTIKNGLLCIALVSLSSVAAQVPKTETCLLTVQDVEKAFGSGFKLKKDEIGGYVSCRYQGEKITIYMRATPLQGMSGDAYRKFMKPKTAVFTMVPGDPDSAMIERRVKDDNDGPAVHYIRNKTVIELWISGLYYGEPSKKEQALKEMNDKLLKLRRVP